MSTRERIPLPKFIEEFLKYIELTAVVILNDKELLDAAVNWPTGTEYLNDEAIMTLYYPNDYAPEYYFLEDLLGLVHVEDNEFEMNRGEHTDRLAIYDLQPVMPDKDLLAAEKVYKTERLIGAHQSWEEFKEE